MVSHWSLSDSKSSQVSRTFLSILVDLNNAEVQMVSIRLLISKFSSTIPLVIVSSAPIIIGITVTFMFHSFFSCLARSRQGLSFPFLLISQSFFVFLYFTLWSNSAIQLVLFFVDNHYIWLSCDTFASQNPKELCASYFPE